MFQNVPKCNENLKYRGLCVCSRAKKIAQYFDLQLNARNVPKSGALEAFQIKVLPSSETFYLKPQQSSIKVTTGPIFWVNPAAYFYLWRITGGYVKLGQQGIDPRRRMRLRRSGEGLELFVQRIQARDFAGHVHARCVPVAYGPVVGDFTQIVKRAVAARFRRKVIRRMVDRFRLEQRRSLARKRRLRRGRMNGQWRRRRHPAHISGR